MSEIDERATVGGTLRTLGERHDVAVEISVGNEGSRTGRITLIVSADGKVEVVQLRSGRAREFSTRWSVEQLHEFGSALAEAGFCSVAERDGEREPDDVRVLLKAVTGSELLCEKNVWHGDRYVDAGLDKIIKRFDAIVSVVTSGELPHGKRLQ